MRIRSTKPEFWRSKTIAQLDWATRLVLKGLESYVDDNGVGKDDLALIAADVFPRDLSGNPTETLRQIAVAISAIENLGLVARYTVGGDDLIYVDRWKQIQYVQHPKAGRFPRPDGTMEYTETVSPASYRKSPANCLPGTGEQGNRGTEEPPYPPSDETPSPEPIPAPTKNRGATLARVQFASLPARSIDAYRIAEAFSASLPTPIENGLLSGIGVQIDKCLHRGIPPPAVAAGLQAWTDSDSWSPTQIPNFVHKANNRSRNGKPTAKALGHEEALQQLLTEVTTL